MTSEGRNHPPRICMASTRNFRKQVFRCAVYEAEDVLVETDSVDLITLRPGRQFQRRDWWQKRLVYRDPFDQIVFTNPGLERVTLNKDYDLFVAMFQYHEDIPSINAIDNWKARSKISVCWIDEIWAASIHKYRRWLSALRKFDHVFVGSSGGSVSHLSAALGRPCHWLPFAVDAARFCPYPNTVSRTIDVYSMGRKLPGIHKTLREMATRKEIFYLHDTYDSAGAPVIDHTQHRDLLATISQRSRYFVVAPAKMDSVGETLGQVEFGPRFYEAITAGSILIGQAPDTSLFRKLFDRQDVVVHVNPDGSDIAAIIQRLSCDPEHLQRMSAQNAIDGLLHHDWSYRWKTMFDVIGLEASSRTIKRQAGLRQLADQVSSMRDLIGKGRVATS